MLGYSPVQIDAMSFRQYMAVVEGYNEANATGEEKPVSMSSARYQELLERYG